LGDAQLVAELLDVVVDLLERLPEVERRDTLGLLLPGDVGGAFFLFIALAVPVALAIFLAIPVSFPPPAATALALLAFLVIFRFTGGLFLRCRRGDRPLGGAPGVDFQIDGRHRFALAAFRGQFQLFFQLGWQRQFLRLFRGRILRRALTFAARGGGLLGLALVAGLQRGGERLGEVGDFLAQRALPAPAPAVDIPGDEREEIGVQAAQAIARVTQDAELRDGRIVDVERAEHDARGHGICLLRREIGQRKLEHPRLAAADENVAHELGMFGAERAFFRIPHRLADGPGEFHPDGRLESEE
jgi:hypothetical protein